MMTLKLDGDFFEFTWTDLREAMKQKENEYYFSQLLVNDGNVNELRHELPADMAGHLDAIADDWTNIRWRIASVVLLERVADIDGFCAAARGAMAGNVKEVAHLVELLNGVDDKECDYWKTILSPLTSPPPQLGSTRTITLPGGATMDMVWCPPTTSDEWKSISGGKDYFMMGSATSEKWREDDEEQHRVTLTKGFWLGKYEVTQALWRNVMGHNPSRFKGDNRPVECVSWEDCQKFIRKVDVKLKCGIRLPTEAEWEYACRAGTTAAYCWGDFFDGGKANCDGNNLCGTMAQKSYLGRTTDVGSYAPNAWGIFDMHGNVCEWCDDWYGRYSGNAIDPTGSQVGSNRVLRGGSWYNLARICRCASRSIQLPSCCSVYNGLRLCCSR